MVIFDCCDPQPVIADDADFPKIDPDDDILAKVDPLFTPPILECEYNRNCIELFKAIEAAKWRDIMEFLETGSWPGVSIIPDFNPTSQAMTVVTHYDKIVPLEEKGHDGEPAAASTTHILWRRIPLQQAVIKGAPIAVVRKLVQLYPESVRWANNHGQLALHLAMLFNANDSVIAFLVKSFPESILAKTKLGFTPFQAALKAEVKDRGIMMAVFIRYAKQELSKKEETALASKAMVPNKEFTCEYTTNCRDLCPLYKKLEAEEWETCLAFLNTGVWPGFFGRWVSGPDEITPREQCKTWVTRLDDTIDDGGEKPEVWSQLPLHVAIICGAPISVIDRLIDLYPQAVLYTDDQGMLPIHLAMYHNADNEVVGKLLLTFPESVNKKSNAGLTPLDCALKTKKSSRGEYLQAFINHEVGSSSNSKNNKSKKKKLADKKKAQAKEAMQGQAIPAIFTFGSVEDDDEEQRAEGSENSLTTDPIEAARE